MAWGGCCADDCYLLEKFCSRNLTLLPASICFQCQPFTVICTWLVPRSRQQCGCSQMSKPQGSSGGKPVRAGAPEHVANACLGGTLHLNEKKDMTYIKPMRRVLHVQMMFMPDMVHVITALAECTQHGHIQALEMRGKELTNNVLSFASGSHGDMLCRG